MDRQSSAVLGRLVQKERILKGNVGCLGAGKNLKQTAKRSWVRVLIYYQWVGYIQTLNSEWVNQLQVDVSAISLWYKFSLLSLSSVVLLWTLIQGFYNLFWIFLTLCILFMAIF